MTNKIKLEPVEEKKEEKTIEKPEIPPPLSLKKNEAIYLINEITDICTIFQASCNLPEITAINQNPLFYIEEILRAFKEFNIIEY